MNFPIKIRCTKAFLVELSESERGAYEDDQQIIEDGGSPARPPESHTFLIAQRHKTVLEIRSPEEAVDVYYAVSSGTVQIYEKGFLNQCRRVANALSDIVDQHDPDLRRRWYPSGY